MVTMRLREAASSTASRFGEPVVPQVSLHVSVGSLLSSCCLVAESRSHRGGLLLWESPSPPPPKGAGGSGVGVDWRGFGPAVSSSRRSTCQQEATTSQPVLPVSGFPMQPCSHPCFAQ